MQSLALSLCLGGGALLCACGGGSPVADENPPMSYPRAIAVDSALGLGFDIRDPRFEEVIDVGAGVVVLAGGFQWSEGPVWVADAGELLFSDVPANVVYRYDPTTVEARERSGVWGVDTFLYPSGYLAEPTISGEPGANGLLLDGEGRLVLMQHGERQVARFRENIANALSRERAIRPTAEDFDVLAGTFDGRRLNSPNDVALAADGTLFFTDPPYGVDKTFGEDARELDFSGVYRLRPGEPEPTLIFRDLKRPNGIVLAPDGRDLIVSNSQTKDMRWVRLSPSATPTDPGAPPARGAVELYSAEAFADLTARVGPDNPGAADGMFMLDSGVLLATGPGGVIAFAPDGAELGTIRTGRPNANVTLGGADGRDVFITADDLLLEARLAK